MSETTKAKLPPNRQMTVEIYETDIVEPNVNFCDPNDGFDVLLKLREDDGTEHQWRSEFSGRYGVGNANQYTQIEMTMRSLKSIGFEGEAHEILDKLDSLVGKRIPAELAYYEGKDGKVRSTVRIGGNMVIKMDKAKAADLIRKLTKKSTTIPPRPPQPSAKPKAAEGNPFEGF